MNSVAAAAILGMYQGALVALGLDLDAAPELAQLTRTQSEALDVILAWRQIDGDRVQQALAHLRCLRVNEQLVAARRRA